VNLIRKRTYNLDKQRKFQLSASFFLNSRICILKPDSDLEPNLIRILPDADPNRWY
jgi:hypothetical protein